MEGGEGRKGARRGGEEGRVGSGEGREEEVWGVGDVRRRRRRSRPRRGGEVEVGVKGGFICMKENAGPIIS